MSRVLTAGESPLVACTRLAKAVDLILVDSFHEFGSYPEAERFHRLVGCNHTSSQEKLSVFFELHKECA